MFLVSWDWAKFRGPSLAEHYEPVKDRYPAVESAKLDQ